MKIAFLNIYQGLVGRGSETFVSEVASRLSDKNKVDVIVKKYLYYSKIITLRGNRHV